MSDLFEPQEDALPPLVSPVGTPPRTPRGGTKASADGLQPSIAVPSPTSSEPRPSALDAPLPVVRCEVRARIPTKWRQDMWLHLYSNNVDNKEHLALVFGPYIWSKGLFEERPGETESDRLTRGAYHARLYPGRISSAGPEPKESPELANVPPLVRIHSECYTGETVQSIRCDCGEQLDEAARIMCLPATPTDINGGVIVYLRQEGRGIGLQEKLKAYNLQDLGHDTVEANLMLRHPGDARSYGLATAILQDLGLGGDRGIRLLTNNPDKIRAVEGPNREVHVAERVPMIPLAWQTGGRNGIQGPEYTSYLATKIKKCNHMLPDPMESKDLSDGDQSSRPLKKAKTSNNENPP
ncbi:hypothetical protein K470DRAFT_254917 [Piedraia hortae CBS 480.64]|uniref:GTP cyclohydrolase II n=1 Tax=Piedraia hortae CBS 480.64 TaxID=1314780 RepID=A0A6A7CAK2_9PEZI|nr:hypothetical protein K470DRAFT_254917 [Piedraia hortae CBS 480.64]